MAELRSAIFWVLNCPIRQGELGAKASPRDVLSVETVNDRPLAQARNYRI